MAYKKFRLTVEGDTLEGHYYRASDAVFGLMRRWDNMRMKRAEAKPRGPERTRAVRAALEPITELCLVIQQLEE